MNFKELEAFVKTHEAAFQAVLATVPTEMLSEEEVEEEVDGLLRRHVERMIGITGKAFPAADLLSRCQARSSRKSFTPPSSRSPPSKMTQTLEEFMEEMSASMEVPASVPEHSDSTKKPITPPHSELSEKPVKEPAPRESCDSRSKWDSPSSENDSEPTNTHTTRKTDTFLKTPTPLRTRKTEPQVLATPVHQQTTRRRSFVSAPRSKQPERGQLGGANKLFGGGPVTKPSYNRNKKPEVVDLISSSDSEDAQAWEVEEESDEGLFIGQRKISNSGTRGRYDVKRATNNRTGAAGKSKEDWMTSHILTLSDDDGIKVARLDVDGFIAAFGRSVASKKRKRNTTTHPGEFRQIDEEDYADSSPSKKPEFKSLSEEHERSDRPGWVPLTPKMASRSTNEHEISRPGWNPLSPQKLGSIVNRSVLAKQAEPAPISDDVAAGFRSFRPTVETDREMEEEMMKDVDDDAAELLPYS